MANEAVNPLDELMKQKYGVTSSGRLQWTEKDDYFTLMRKVARYIYKQQDWTERREMGAIMALNSVLNNDFDTKISSADRKIPDADRVYKIKGEDKTYLWGISSDNKLTSKQGVMYSFRNTGTTFTYGNLADTVGYGALLRDIYNNFLHDQKLGRKFLNTPEDLVKELTGLTVAYGRKYRDHGILTTRVDAKELSCTKEELEALTHVVIHPVRGTEIGRVFNDPKIQEEDPRFHLIGYQFSIDTALRRINDRAKHVEFKNYLNDYLEQTFNIVRQQRYNQDRDKQTRAKAWETKKNINKETQQVMDNSPLAKTFSKLEIDNDVDLKGFGSFEREMMNLVHDLPKVYNTKLPTLRLRKLGNYKAAGLYVPQFGDGSTDTIALDFRKARTEGEHLKGLGVQSFIHEYGHYLDNHLGTPIEEGKSGKVDLSISTKFSDITREYRRNLDQYTIKKDKGIGSAEYFGIPTEIFARGFELWTHNHLKMKSNLMDAPKAYQNDPEYKAFTPELREKVFEFFDNIPELTQARERLANKDYSLIDEKQITVPTKQDPEQLVTKQDLDQYAGTLLNKLTMDVDRLEALIGGSGSQLAENNPNRVIAFDNYQSQGLPRLVSDRELQEAGVDLKAYQTDNLTLRGYVVDEQVRYQAGTLYNANELTKQATLNGNELDYQRLNKLIEERNGEGGSLDKAMDQAGLTVAASDSLLASAFNRAERRMVSDSLNGKDRDTRTQGIPFKFSEAEREKLAGVPRSLRRKLYLDTVKAAKEIQPQVAKNLKREKVQSQSKLPTIKAASKAKER